MGAHTLYAEIGPRLCPRKYSRMTGKVTPAIWFARPCQQLAGLQATTGVVQTYPHAWYQIFGHPALYVLFLPPIVLHYNMLACAIVFSAIESKTSRRSLQGVRFRLFFCQPSRWQRPDIRMPPLCSRICSTLRCVHRMRAMPGGRIPGGMGQAKLWG